MSVDGKYEVSGVRGAQKPVPGRGEPVRVQPDHRHEVGEDEVELPVNTASVGRELQQVAAEIRADQSVAQMS
ncbi:SLC13 family permease [Babesia caballi]|uniref:SLC13 family permease n=1 Tax=Babesia caballi TaxID=5871 RepID=A0AAV4LM92_BABCB|nr:SLC13 family permease [Babesia caballi]